MKKPSKKDVEKLAKESGLGYKEMKVDRKQMITILDELTTVLNKYNISSMELLFIVTVLKDSTEKFCKEEFGVVDIGFGRNDAMQKLVSKKSVSYVR